MAGELRLGVHEFGNTAYWHDPEDFCRPATCAYCGQYPVFFVRHNGGAAWFDELGWPWPKHECYLSTATAARPSVAAIPTRLAQAPSAIDYLLAVLADRPGGRFAVVASAVRAPANLCILALRLPDGGSRVAVAEWSERARRLAGALALWQPDAEDVTLFVGGSNPLLACTMLPIGGAGWPALDSIGPSSKTGGIVHRTPEGFGVITGVAGGDGAKGEVQVLFSSGKRKRFAFGQSQLRYFELVRVESVPNHTAGQLQGDLKSTEGRRRILRRTNR